MAAYTLITPSMSCGSCIGRIEKAVSNMQDIHDVSVNLATQAVRFEAETPAVVAKVAEALTKMGYAPKTETIDLDVENMHCGSCVGRVETLLKKLDGVQDAHVNLATQSAHIIALDGQAVQRTVVDALTQSGFPGTLQVSGTMPNNSNDYSEVIEDTRRRALTAAVFVLPIFILEMGSHLFPAFHHFIAGTIGVTTSWIIQGLLCTIVLFWPGRSFFTIGLRNLVSGHPDMNALVAMGAGSAWLYSVVVLLAPNLVPDQGRAVYFEAAAIIVLLILVGRWMEARAKGQTGAAITALLNLQPQTAIRLDGTHPQEVLLNALQLDDIILVRAGARIPTDATVTKGSSFVDESMMTGEPAPVSKASGDTVIGGTINTNGTLECRVTHVGAETTLAQIVRMVQSAQSAKLPIQALVDRVTLWFVPTIILLALTTVAAWLIFGPSAGLAVVAGVSVLIIACPCAMGLATPTSIMVGSGRAAELGVLFRKGDALQGLTQVRAVAFDKTGTLTQGAPVVTKIDTFGTWTMNSVMKVAMSLEVLSDHPLARAIVTDAETKGIVAHSVEDFETVLGRGVVGSVQGHRVAIGTSAFMAEQDITPFDRDLTVIGGETVVFVGIDGKIAATIYISDPLKAGSAATISALKRQGLYVTLITGDRSDTAHAIGRQLGIDAVIAEVMPNAKAAEIAKLQVHHGPVAFVGDGINDAPALAQADIGIAIGSGTDVAVETADVVLMGDDMNGVLTAFKVSSVTMRNIRQNLVWAFGYNVALIPVAAGALYPAFGVLLSPMFAAGAMALSSVCVLSNALRLRGLSR